MASVTAAAAVKPRSHSKVHRSKLRLADSPVRAELGVGDGFVGDSGPQPVDEHCGLPAGAHGEPELDPG